MSRMLRWRCANATTRSGVAGPSWFPVLDDELKRDRAVPIVGVGSINGPDRGRQGVGVIEENGGETQRSATCAALENELRMPAGDCSLVRNGEYLAERGRRETLAPDVSRQRLGEVERNLGQFDPPVRRLDPREIGNASRRRSDRPNGGPG